MCLPLSDSPANYTMRSKRTRQIIVWVTVIAMVLALIFTAIAIIFG